MTPLDAAISPLAAELTAERAKCGKLHRQLMRAELALMGAATVAEFAAEEHGCPTRYAAEKLVEINAVLDELRADRAETLRILRDKETSNG